MPKKTITKQVGGNAKPPARKKTGSILDRIEPLYFDEDEGISLAVYGKSGTGKTTFIGTFPGKLLWILCSGGQNPGELRSLNTSENRKRIEKFVPQSVDEVAQIIEHQAETDEYSGIVIDHLTGFQDLVMGEILGKRVPEQKAWGLATQQQYAQCTLTCKEVLRPLLDLRCHRIMIAQERDFNKEDSSNDLIMPTVGAALSPSLTGWLNYVCDYVCQTYIRQKKVSKKVTINGKEKTTLEATRGVEFCLRTAPDPIYMTKFRKPKGKEMPDVIVDPSYDKLMEVIRG